jgi:hypothetical protein
MTLITFVLTGINKAAYWGDYIPEDSTVIVIAVVSGGAFAAALQTGAALERSFRQCMCNNY